MFKMIYISNKQEVNCNMNVDYAAMTNAPVYTNIHPQTDTRTFRQSSKSKFQIEHQFLLRIQKTAKNVTDPPVEKAT